MLNHGRRVVTNAIGLLALLDACIVVLLLVDDVLTAPPGGAIGVGFEIVIGVLVFVPTLAFGIRLLDRYRPVPLWMLGTAGVSVLPLTTILIFLTWANLAVR